MKKSKLGWALNPEIWLESCTLKPNGFEHELVQHTLYTQSHLFLTTMLLCRQNDPPFANKLSLKEIIELSKCSLLRGDRLKWESKSLWLYMYFEINNDVTSIKINFLINRSKYTWFYWQIILDLFFKKIVLKTPDYWLYYFYIKKIKFTWQCPVKIKIPFFLNLLIDFYFNHYFSFSFWTYCKISPGDQHVYPLEKELFFHFLILVATGHPKNSVQ